VRRVLSSDLKDAVEVGAAPCPLDAIVSSSIIASSIIASSSSGHGCLSSSHRILLKTPLHRSSPATWPTRSARAGDGGAWDASLWKSLVDLVLPVLLVILCRRNDMPVTGFTSFPDDGDLEEAQQWRGHLFGSARRA
jgi:hypothetical protein